MRLRTLSLLLDVLLTLVLQKSEVFVHLLQRVVISVEGVNDVVLIDINLIGNIERLFDEIDELLHLLPE